MFSTDTPRLVDQFGLPIPRDGDESQALIPHPLTFGYVLNTIAKTYSFRWDEALRHLPQNALAMRRDCFIRSLLQERKLPTANRSWQLTPDDPRDPAQRRAVQTLTRCIKQTRRWRRFLAYLLEAIWYGRYGAQITWERRPIGNGERAWCVGSHTPVNGDKIQFAWDDSPVVFINQAGAGRYPPEFIVYTDRVPGLRLAKQNWRDQFIIHTHEVDDADYFEGEMAGAVHGVGLRNWIYWAWWLRDEMLGWAVDFMKKVGTLGLLVFWYELGNKAAKAEAEKNAQRASKETALVMGRPGAKDTSAWGVDHVGISMTGVETLQRMIQDYFEHHMERLIVGQTLSADAKGQGLGGSGVAALHENTKFQLLQFDADNLAETLTDDLVGPLLRKNFPDADFGVRFEFNVEAPDNDSKMKAVQSAAALGVTFRMDEVRELTGMSKPAEGEETVGAAGQTSKTSGQHNADDAAANLNERSDEAPLLYVKNPEFEAKHPRSKDGKFGKKEASGEPARPASTEPKRHADSAMREIDQNRFAQEPYGKTIKVLRTDGSSPPSDVKVPSLEKIQEMAEDLGFEPNFKGWLNHFYPDVIVHGSQAEKDLKEAPPLAPHIDKKTIDQMDNATLEYDRLRQEERERDLFKRVALIPDEAGPEATAWFASDIVAQIDYRKYDIARVYGDLLPDNGIAPKSPGFRLEMNSADLNVFKYQAKYLMASKWYRFRDPKIGEKGYATVVVAGVPLRKNILGNIEFGIVGNLLPPSTLSDVAVMRVGYGLGNKYGVDYDGNAHPHQANMKGFVGDYRADNLSAFGVGAEIADRIRSLKSWQKNGKVSESQVTEILRSVLGSYDGLHKAVNRYASLYPTIKPPVFSVGALTAIEYHGGTNTLLLTIPENNKEVEGPSSIEYFDTVLKPAYDKYAAAEKAHGRSPMGIDQWLPLRNCK